ncbi:MAG TPA: SprT family zinc-dependent metalloprotease [Selenomonadales bacterium]|nr:SprT family zinc-dependent metalloprotease [Selenomonadales bacterium]
MPTIVIGTRRLNYTVRYSRRRTVGIKLVPPDLLEVAAPAGFPGASIEAVLLKKAAWIAGHLRRLAATAANPINAGLQPGSQLLYLGRPLSLRIVPAKTARPKVEQDGRQLLVHLPPAPDRAQAGLLAEALKKWYIHAARELLAERTAFWAGEIGVRPCRLFIREQKSRWGSCSSRGNINYNWRIVMAPPEVVDYLVVHELCHIKVPNHSKDFWLLVGQAVPDYKRHRKWLRENGELLMRLFSP